MQGLVKGRAKEVIQSFECDGNYYEEAIVELKRRFGRPTVIVGTMIQRLIQHLPPVPNRPDTYIKFLSFNKTIIRVYEAHNFTADLYSTTILKHATDNLPFLDAANWQQFLVKEKIEQPNLSILSDWLQQIAEAYEQLEQQNVEHPATHQVHFVQNSKTTTATYRQSPRIFCPLKDGLHQIFKSEKFKKMSPEERHVNVKALGLCFNCLSQNHLLKGCLSKSKCRINNCNPRHNTLLHREKTAPKSNSVNFLQQTAGKNER